MPALIEFPDQPIAVLDPAQTESFFASAVGQYAEVSDAQAVIDVLAATGHSLWVDVTWRYDGKPAERNLYQLVRVADHWRIAVLTPLEL